MKTRLFGSIIILLFLLTACSSSNDLDVTVEKDLVDLKDKPSTFEIKVMEQDKPAEGLKIKAQLSMVEMDHGTYEATFIEKEQGLYSSEVELPMAGKWEIVFALEKDGKSVEKVIEYDVKEPTGVASINGQWITREDIDFYRFINELHIAINREQAKTAYTGKELDSVLANLDDQEKAIQDQNTLLTQIIRLRAMALLGEEKGFKASDDEVKTEIQTVREQYEQQDVAKAMIEKFGEEKFWGKQEKQYKLIILSQKVQTDLISKVKKENSHVNEQEILYLAQKQYEDLLVSQVNSLTIEIL